MEQNKTGKYLKYAIGEIVLVVIGILIALSINNWNELRKARIQSENLKKQYLLSIHKDLKNDINLINDNINRFSVQYEAGIEVLEAFESQKYKEIDSARIAYLIAWKLSDIIPNYRNENTWDGLKVRGEQALVKDDTLISLINTFYKNFDKQLDRFNQLPRKARMDIRELASQCHNTYELSQLKETELTKMEIYHGSLARKCIFKIKELHKLASTITITSIINEKLLLQMRSEIEFCIKYLGNKYAFLNN